MRRLSIAFGALSLALAMPAASQQLDPGGWVKLKQSVSLPNGMTLRYVDAGDPKGKPLILIHGWTDTSRSWALLVPELKRHRLIIPDLRGHGGSDKPECCFGVGELANDIRLLLDAKRIDRVTVAGHSLGSVVAQRLAFDHPERIDRLVLIASTVTPALQPGDWVWNNVMALGDKIDPNAPFINEWVSGPTPIDPAFLAAVRPETAATPRHVWRGVAHELATTQLVRAAERITAPVMIIWGDQDPLFGADAQAALRAALPHASFHTFKGLGHNTHWEAPRAVGALIADFVDSPMARPRAMPVK